MSTNKSFSTETSERYSRALFEVANEDKELDKVENDVKNFHSIFQNYLEMNKDLISRIKIHSQHECASCMKKLFQTH